MMNSGGQASPPLFACIKLRQNMSRQSKNNRSALTTDNLRQLVDKTIIYADAEGLRLQINLNASFTEHMTIFDQDGKELTDLRVINNQYPLPMRRRIKTEKK